MGRHASEVGREPPKIHGSQCCVKHGYGIRNKHKTKTLRGVMNIAANIPNQGNQKCKRKRVCGHQTKNEQLV